MIEQDPIAGIKMIGFSVVHRNPVRIQLGHTIRTLGIKGVSSFWGAVSGRPPNSSGRGCLIVPASNFRH